MQSAATYSNINHNLASDYAAQDLLLPGVSRTFALTIPQLPPPLATVVTNAYLLCRIADTIEDDEGLSPAAKAEFEKQYIQVVIHAADPCEFRQALLLALSENTRPAERELINQIPTVIRCLKSFNPRQQRSLERCVRIMSQGMAQFQRHASLKGLNDLNELNRYCYYVAGVVGEMLTELFCDYSLAIDKHYPELMALALSFGQGLQMTNVLKDIWDDYQRGVCWYPRDIFSQHGIELTKLDRQHHLVGFESGLKQLIAITAGHLENALHYTLLLPTQETGLRRFCLWALGLAVLTLRKLYRHPKFKSGAQVKVSRRMVKTAIFTSNLFAQNNTMLKYLFKFAAAGLPQISQPTTHLFTEWSDHE